MIISLDTITIIAMLVVSFLSLSRYLPLVCQASQIAMKASNLSTSQQNLVWLCYCLLSLSYSVASYRCSAGCSMLEHGYHDISYLINASIYLVVCGRLGLLPSVLFHSCRPSFRNTGVMFLDERF